MHLITCTECHLPNFCQYTDCCEEEG